MNPIMTYLMVIGAMFAFSTICALTRKGFSLHIFLTGFVISILVLVWQTVLPTYMIIIASLILVAILMVNDGGDSDE
jgi:hypothetical protein